MCERAFFPAGILTTSRKRTGKGIECRWAWGDSGSCNGQAGFWHLVAGPINDLRTLPMISGSYGQHVMLTIIHNTNDVCALRRLMLHIPHISSLRDCERALCVCDRNISTRIRQKMCMYNGFLCWTLKPTKFLPEKILHNGFCMHTLYSSYTLFKIKTNPEENEAYIHAK